MPGRVWKPQSLSRVQDRYAAAVAEGYFRELERYRSRPHGTKLASYLPPAPVEIIYPEDGSCPGCKQIIREMLRDREGGKRICCLCNRVINGGPRKYRKVV